MKRTGSVSNWNAPAWAARLLVVTFLFVAAPVRAQTAGSVSGVVLSSDGKAVAGAAVQLTSTAAAFTATTATNGRFAIAAVPAGVYRIRISKAGYAQFTRTVRIEGATDVGTFALRPSLRIVGSVVSRERLPLNVTPSSIKVFPREAYRDQGQPSMNAVLDQTQGVDTIQSAAENTAQPLAPFGVSVRGGSPFDTAFLIDGNPVSLPGSGAFNAAYVPTFVVQDVEVARGAGSAETTMSGAVNGTVNVRTADPGATRRGMLEFERDTRDGQFSDFAYGGPVDDRLSFTTMFSFDGNNGPALERAQLLKARYALSGASTATLTYLGTQGYVDNAWAPFSQQGDTHALNLTSLDVHSDGSHNHIAARFFAMRLRQDVADDPFVDPSSVSGASLQDDVDAGDTTYQLQTTYRNGFAGSLSRHEEMIRAAVLTQASQRVDTQLSAVAIWLNSTFATVVHAGAAFHVLPTLTTRFSIGNGVALDPYGRFDNAATADAGLEYRLHGDTTTVSADVFSTGGLYRRNGVELGITQFKRVGLGYIAQFGSRSGDGDPLFPVANSQGYGEISYKWPRGSRLSFGALYVGAGSVYASNAFVQLNSNLELSLGNVSKLQLSIENPSGVQNRIPAGIRLMFREALGGPIIER